MTTKIKWLTSAPLLALSLTGAAAFAQFNPSSLPPAPQGVDEDAIWAKYCIGDRRTPERPRVNYSNPAVVDAARKLATVSDFSFYFYSGPMRAYGLRGPNTEALAPDFPADIKESFKDGRKNAHAYLLQSCGEFRDRPTMIEEKINWARKIYLLPDEPQKPIDLKKDIWSQVSARSYRPYLEASARIWQNRQMAMTMEGTDLVQIGEAKVDAPVDGFTVCETKYIFKNYVEKNIPVPSFPYGWYPNMPEAELQNFKQALKVSWGTYTDGLTAFMADPNNCSQADKEHYYDFRGDSNLKHYSPESNGMIWYSSSITGKCEYDAAAKRYKSKADFGGIDMCNEYFTRPFAYRWSAARAGLGAWLFRNPDLDSSFQDQYTSVTVLPHFSPDKKPFTFRLSGQPVATEHFDNKWTSSLNIFWNTPGMGFNERWGITPGQSSFDGPYTLLRDAMNRHTNWYQSGYDDAMGLTRDQAYSPFVASSYEMSKSDGFTAPGATVASPRDGCKHWMYVFKIHKDNLYSTASLKAGKPIDFNRHWFDETSFGTDHLAKAERAWDRLGTALEGEYDSMLYLHNIADYGSVDTKCWAASAPPPTDAPAVGTEP